jgi:hypothetical protein
VIRKESLATAACQALRFVTRKQAEADIQAAIPNFEMPR